MSIRFSPKAIFAAAAAVSVIWWAFLVYESLTYTPVCNSDDKLCINGQTVAGDILFSTAFAVITLIPVWGGAAVVCLAHRYIRGTTAYARLLRGSLYAAAALLVMAAILVWL
jgi:hypothetical protein